MDNSTKTLLTEWTPLRYTSKMISESKELNDGKILLKGVLQKCDTLNQNGRIYPRSILDREVINYQKFIKERRASWRVRSSRFVCRRIKKCISSRKTSAKMDGDSLVGTIEILNTPSGNILKSLIEAGV